MITINVYMIIIIKELDVFSKLNLCNISKAGGTCRKWRCLSMDVKTIQCIAKREFDYQEWMKQDFCPQKFP